MFWCSNLRGIEANLFGAIFGRFAIIFLLKMAQKWSPKKFASIPLRSLTPPPVTNPKKAPIETLLRYETIASSIPKAIKCCMEAWKHL